MKHTVLILVALCLCTLGAGCTRKAPNESPSPSPSPMMDVTDLNTPLREEYERVRLLTQESTPDAFFAAIDPSVLSEQTKSEMRQGWKFAPQLMKDMMPSFTDPKVKFVKLEHNNEWAGYYYAYRTEDGITSLAVRRFHRVNGAWKVADFSMTSLSGNAYETLDMNEIEQVIRESSIMGVVPPSKK